MPLSDLFKKKPKNETVQASQTKPGSPAGDDSFLSPEMQKKRYDAAMEFVAALQERTPLVGGKPHAATVLALTARLAGSSLFRSLNYSTRDIQPGMVVLSDEVNEAWPQLMNQFAFYCKQNGVDVMSKPMVTEFPEPHKPLMSVEEVLAEYQDQYHEIMKKHGLDYLNGARAGMIVASIVFEYHCRQAKDIDPFVAAGIVAMGVVEGAKTAPPPPGSKATTMAPANQTAKNNDRLVLGERDAAIQEALDNGGSFIDPHPEVMSMLEAGGIDPYLIYEKALLQKIEEKIGRIDFVKASVDQLYQEWRAKPSQAPTHVRLIFWLKDNASKYGYQQSGNSWIRK
jgi:hypothetical protein